MGILNQQMGDIPGTQMQVYSSNHRRQKLGPERLDTSQCPFRRWRGLFFFFSSVQLFHLHCVDGGEFLVAVHLFHDYSSNNLPWPKIHRHGKLTQPSPPTSKLLEEMWLGYPSIPGPDGCHLDSKSDVPWYHSAQVYGHRRQATGLIQVLL